MKWVQAAQAIQSIGTNAVPYPCQNALFTSNAAMEAEPACSRMTNSWSGEASWASASSLGLPRRVARGML